MNIYGLNIHLLAAFAALATVIPAARENNANDRAAAAHSIRHEARIAARSFHYEAKAVAMQRATAQVKVIPSSGAYSWPNDGVMPILTYGWGGDRPLPPIMAIDSSIIPQLGAPRPPILIVQRRSDNFSPLLRNLLDQGESVRAMTIVIAPISRETMSYTMWNARIIGIRDVGRVIEENPTTEEIVITFERLSLGAWDEAEF